MHPLIRRLYYGLGPSLQKTGFLLEKPGLLGSVTRITAGLFFNLVCRKFETRIFVSKEGLSIQKGKRLIKLNPRHYIYTPTVAKEFEVYFGSVFSHSEGEFSCVDFSHAGLQRFTRSQLEFEITGFPEEESVILDYFRWYEPQPGDTVFDIGANCGLSTYYLSVRVGPSGKVYAFEPDFQNHQMLLRNIARHGLGNVIPVRKAVASQTGQMTFFSEGTIGSILAKHSDRPSTGTVETVETITLADAFQAYEIPAFIKMDIEGAEVEVIESSQKLIENLSLNFAIDTNHWKNGQFTDKTIERFFKAIGYETISSNEGGFQTTWSRKLK